MLSLETIGYFLYGGLLLSIFSFLFLMLGMIQKNNNGTIFDQALEDEEEYEEYNVEEDLDEEEVPPQKKGLFGGFRRKNKHQLEEEDEDEYVSDDDMYVEDDNEEDEYSKEFDITYEVDDDNEYSKDRATYENLNFQEIDDDGENDVMFDEGYKIKKYADDEEIEQGKNRYTEDYDEEAEILKRIHQYKDKLKLD